MVETIKYGDTILAIVVRSSFSHDGISFFTPPDFSQQLAFMKHPIGKIIAAHTHNNVERTVMHTKETLVIKKGCLRVDLYTDDGRYLESRILNSGDVILLTQGGHGFEVLEAVEMFEIKQGPFAGAQDKTLIPAVEAASIKMESGVS